MYKICSTKKKSLDCRFFFVNDPVTIYRTERWNEYLYTLSAHIYTRTHI